MRTIEGVNSKSLCALLRELNGTVMGTIEGVQLNTLLELLREYN